MKLCEKIVLDIRQNSKIHIYFKSTEEDIPFTLKLKWGAQKTQVTHTAWDIKKLGQGAGSSSDPGSLKKYMWLTTINHNPQA